MSEIICQWLNDELKLSRRVEPKTFAKEFATGYLIGEVLLKYQLQDDFDQFSQSRVSSSKLNNFSRIEPTLQLLGIPFDQNVAQTIISEQHGAATRLLYQMYIALQKKKKAGLTGVAMETLRPAAPAKLQSIGTEIYRERLKTIVPRQSDISLQKVTEQFEIKSKEMDEKEAQIHNEELRKIQKIQEELRLQDIEKLRQARRRQNEIMARIQAAIVQIPKPPPNRTLKAMEAQKMLKKKKEAEDVYTEITRFEKTVRKDGSNSNLSSNRSPTLQRLRSTVNVGTAVLKMEPTDDYIRKIQKRLEEDNTAREQREKRRRKILMEQLVTHEAQEEAFREEQLINRLMRQSQQERRIAVQLMHVRHEKEVLKQNRMFREKQYEERRKQEFQEALDREAALQKQTKLDCEEQIRKVQELHDQIAAERAEAHYKKHYFICQEIINQIVDLATKTGEYRELTNRLIPKKLMNEWKELFFSGYPLYEKTSVNTLGSKPTPEELIEVEKQVLLDEKDYEEYKTMTGEWIPREGGNVKTPAPNNILGHVVQRLFDITNPPKAPSPPPVFPPFPIKGCILGKVFSGKSTCVKHLAQVYSVQILCADSLVQEAIQAYSENKVKNDECANEEGEDGKENKPIESSSSFPTELDISNVESAIKKNIDQTEKIISPREATSVSNVNSLQKLSSRAQLGGIAEKHLKMGKGIPDELLINILVEAIKHIPANSGWIMDGFPTTLTQAKLFEKALTGNDPEKGARSKKSKASSLVKNPTAAKEPSPLPPSFDFAVLIEVSDNIVLQRFAEKKGKSNTVTFQEGNPSSDGEEHARDQIQHRIAGFLDNWEQLETWFSVKQNILVKVDGEVEEAVLCKKMEEVFLTAMHSKENKVKEVEKKEETPPPSPPVTPPPPPVTTTELRPTSAPKQNSAKNGRKISKSPKGRSDSSTNKKEKKKDTPRGRDSEQKSAKSGSSRGRSSAKKSKSVSVSPEPIDPIPVGPPPIQPGSPEWVYVNEPLPKEIPEFLVPYWETVENTYGNTIKSVLRSVRDEQQIVIRYLYNIKNQFKDFLKRPDFKQEFVSQWQDDFSSFAEDVWEDEEIKAELHQRVDDLRDRLWDICDKRKEEAEQERNDIMNDGWLQDHTGILINFFFSLMQAEMDRFQDTVKLLHDYYEGMEKKIPLEISKDFTRIPLVDIINANLPGDPENPRRIPLIPRRSLSSEQSAGKQKSKATQLKVKEDHSMESTRHSYETDEKLIIDTWQMAVTAFANMVAHEVQLKEEEENAEQQMMEMKEKAPTAASQKGAKKKPPKSPNRKKGEKSPGPEPATSLTPEENAELQKKQELKLKMKQEYLAALTSEEAAADSRLELIKWKALEMYQDIISRAEDAYKDMEMCLGTRFLGEMSSIDTLVQVVRNHIETSSKIKYELVLEQTDFYINADVKVIPDPPPPPPMPPVETPTDTIITILQLQKMYEHFLLVAPEGRMFDKEFTRILHSLITNDTADFVLPDLWMFLSLLEVQEMVSEFSDDANLVNWRMFLLSAAQPWPYPSVNQLLDTLGRFKAIDHNECGTSTQEMYNQAELWFTGEVGEQRHEDLTEPLPFNRQKHLLQFFFILFADPKTDPPKLNYTEMLLYFASHHDRTQGFYRALSLLNGKNILNQSEGSIFLKSLPRTDLINQSNGQIKKEDELLCISENATTTLQALLRVFQQKSIENTEFNRFSSEPVETNTCYKKIKDIFTELSNENLEPVAFTTLMKHPVFADLVDNCQSYNLPNIYEILLRIVQRPSSEGETIISSLSNKQQKDEQEEKEDTL
ncbi:sperm flagellar protein 2 [Bombina bombina]|uniref:sperm flagellar protein 2 n=1 Tax=Bombina bombina TaxID=8345 RepID=UPI00235A9A7B|nr:sperm flagellar protein 2 [Bombina bombina]